MRVISYTRSEIESLDQHLQGLMDFLDRQKSVGEIIVSTLDILDIQCAHVDAETLLDRYSARFAPEDTPAPAVSSPLAFAGAG